MNRAKAAAKWLATLALLAVWGSSASAQAVAVQKPTPQPAQNQAQKATPAKPATAQTQLKAQAPPKAQKPAKKAKAAPAAKPEKAENKEVATHRRDPFEPLVSKKTGTEAALNLPPGKAGLLISTVRIDGTVRGPNGMIAMVSNPPRRVYFLREGDRVYDGRVERIDLEGVVFRQSAKDAFGKVVERLVTKRIYPTVGEQPGEQQ